MKGIVDVKQVFLHLKDEVYCIVKSFNLDEYESGSDIDVFCYDMYSFSTRLIQALEAYLEQDTFTLSMNETVVGKHIHADLLRNGKLEIRFDLYGTMPSYTHVLVKDSLFGSIIENAESHTIQYGEDSFPIFIPSEVDNLLIRYLEYKEWYEERPDKLKHFEYILSQVEQDPKRISFLDKLHYYTSLPEVSLAGKKKSRTALMKEYYTKIRSTPKKKLFGILMKKIRTRA